MRSLLLLTWMLLYVRNCDCLSDKEYARLPPIFQNDNYDRCMLFEDEALYCFVTFKLKPVDPVSPSDTWRNIQELNKDFKNYRHDLLRHGVCIPITCPNISKSDPEFEKDLATCYLKKYEHLGVHGTVEELSCRTAKPPPFDSWDITVATLLILYIMLIIYASFYEGSARYDSIEEYQKKTGSTYGRFISCFSIPRNWRRLKTVKSTPELEKLRGVQGIRFYNMALVILSHAAMFATMGPVSNTLFSERTFDNPGSIFLASGLFAVETFFILSAWFLSYHIFKNFNADTGRKLTLRIALFTLFYRFIRLVPLILFSVMVLSSVGYHIGDGPLWEIFAGRDREFCRENGWTNVLFLNNLINIDRMCFIETWYTAMDMQGFVVCLVILYFTVHNPRRLLWIIPAVAVVAQGSFLKKLYDKKIYSPMPPTAENLYKFNALYEKDGIWANVLPTPDGNIIGSLLGLVAGYLYYKHENDQVFTKKIHVVLWWILSFVNCFAVIILPGMWLFSKNYYESFWFTLPYMGLSTFIYGVGICVGIFGMSKGVGSLTLWAVQWSPLYVLGRLSYSTYIAHYFVILYKIGNSRELIHGSNIEITLVTIEFLAHSILLGLIFSLTVELPFSALQSAYIKDKIVVNSKKEAVNGLKKD